MGLLERLRGAISTQSGKSAPRRNWAYLIPLWDTKPWSAAEAESVRSGKATELRVPVVLLEPVQVKGVFPVGPDEFVISTALLACRKRGIPFDGERDTITFSGGQFSPGEGAGLITIQIHAPPPTTEYTYTPLIRKLLRKTDVDRLEELARRPTKGKERAFSMHALLDLLGHADTTVRAKAQESIARLLVEEDFARSMIGFLLVREQHMAAIEQTPQLKAQVVDVLIGETTSSEFTRRATSAIRLGALRDPRAIPALRALLGDPHDVPRQRASEALGALEPTLRGLAATGDVWASQQLRELDERIDAGAGAKAAESETAAEPEAQQMVEAHAQHGSVDFDADGRVAYVNLPTGKWTLEERGQTRYYIQHAASLLHATELLKAVSSVPAETYYTVETPDGALSRDLIGFYAESPIKTSRLTLVTTKPVSETVESVSLTAYGNAMNSQIGVAQLKLQGKYAKFVLLMECGHCGYRSPVETDAGSMQRQCYCCGATNNTTRGTITMNLGPNSVEI